jgi:hypothetical protein
MLDGQFLIDHAELVTEVAKCLDFLTVRQRRADVVYTTSQFFDLSHRPMDSVQLPFKLGDQVELVRNEEFGFPLESPVLSRTVIEIHIRHQRARIVEGDS